MTTASTTSAVATDRRTLLDRMAARAASGHQCRSSRADSWRTAQPRPRTASRPARAFVPSASGRPARTVRVPCARASTPRAADQRRRSSRAAAATAYVGESTAGASLSPWRAGQDGAAGAVDGLAAQPAAPGSVARRGGPRRRGRSAPGRRVRPAARRGRRPRRPAGPGRSPSAEGVGPGRPGRRSAARRRRHPDGPPQGVSPRVEGRCRGVVPLEPAGPRGTGDPTHLRPDERHARVGEVAGQSEQVCGGRPRRRSRRRRRTACVTTARPALRAPAGPTLTGSATSVGAVSARRLPPPAAGRGRRRRRRRTRSGRSAARRGRAGRPVADRDDDGEIGRRSAGTVERSGSAEVGGEQPLGEAAEAGRVR